MKQDKTTWPSGGRMAPFLTLTISSTWTGGWCSHRPHGRFLQFPHSVKRFLFENKITLVSYDTVILLVLFSEWVLYLYGKTDETGYTWLHLLFLYFEFFSVGTYFQVLDIEMVINDGEAGVVIYQPVCPNLPSPSFHFLTKHPCYFAIHVCAVFYLYEL